MTETITTQTPVSEVLEADLRNWVRRNGIVVWLDMSDDYSGFVDELCQRHKNQELPYQVKAFRGSHLQLMLELETLGGGVVKSPLVVHLPCFNEESVKDTPLLELYTAGVRYRKKLDTLITEAASGRVRQEQIEAYKAQGSVSLDSADSWLAALLNDHEGGLGAQLQTMAPSALMDDLITQQYVANRLVSNHDRVLVWERLDAWTGLNDTWREACFTSAIPSHHDVAFTAASWALCVEYVDDLKRAPVSPLLARASQLPREVVDICCSLASHLRERHRDFYRHCADETEVRLAEEVDNASGADLGDIDTFRFEGDKVLEDALKALQEGDWAVAESFARQRVSGDSFWLQEDAYACHVWELVEQSAELGLCINQAGPRLNAVSGLESAVERYVSHGAAVDQAHRKLEQSRLNLLYPQLPEFTRLRAQLDTMRLVWRTWADAWACDFSALCKTHGFLPESTWQQRSLFDDVVQPMTTESGVTAYFVVDALRFEMAEQLYQELKATPATRIELKPRLSELPSVTEVGMNVLAPVTKDGKLQPSLAKGKVKGFSTGEYRVFNPDTRKRAMHDRVGGATCPWLSLSDVLSRDNLTLKKTIAQAKLLVVHSQEIDKAGEKDAGPAVFEVVLRQLRAAWKLLRDAGVVRFVITSDHGFLLLDGNSGPAQSHGRKIDPKRRHVFSDVAVDHRGEVRVALSNLGYQDVDGYLMLPESTAVFDTGNHSMSFVHGGNSLQERVIPVLSLVHRKVAGGSTVKYRIEAKPQEDVLDMHSLSAKVIVTSQSSMDFVSQKEVELGLSILDGVEAQAELCQVRGAARLLGGSIYAEVDQTFELFFRLKGHSTTRVRVELNHPSATAQVEACVLDARYALSSVGLATPAVLEASAPVPVGRDWLDELPSDGGVRQLFEHLGTYDAVTESEAVGMLGSQRALRKFARRFEDYALLAPFEIRIDVVGGVKRYVRVREGE